MHYLALACDYDGTIARDGRVADQTIAALERLRASGRKLILVTGRELDDLLAIFPRVDLFEWVVAENGCLLYQSATQEIHATCPAPAEVFIAALRARAVEPLSVGKVIVATCVPHETTVIEVIRELGLELQVIFNKGAVMIVPAGKNKATGLTAALEKLGLSAHNVVGIGDAENDHAFLALCACGVAVANALPMLKEHADFVTKGEAGAGVVELIDELMENDLAGREPLLVRHHLLLGTREDDTELRVAPHGVNILLAGPSGAGKSTITSGIVERLAQQHYQFCIIDPEGDYQDLEGTVALGAADRVPTIEEVMRLMQKPDTNAAVNLVGIPFNDRPAFFMSLLSRISELRAKTGRPHVVIVDEAHHVLPASWQPSNLALPQKIKGVLYITLEPASLMPAVISSIDMLLAIGETPERTVEEFAGATALALPPLPENTPLERGELLVWEIGAEHRPFKIRGIPGRAQRRRHLRKYSEGDLGPDRSFYFRGREGKLNLKAQNLIVFMQLADGIDDQTWTYHLRHGDYSHWFAACIKDEMLAREAKTIETNEHLSPAESRRLIKDAITKRFTLPARA